MASAEADVIDGGGGDVVVEPAGRRRWLLAGQQLLRTGGIPSVKIAALVAETGLTTGSLYHHFGSMDAFLDELARFYGDARPTELLGRVAEADPRRRLRQLNRIARDERMRPLDAAMRDWAGSNEVAAEAVRRSDEVLLGFTEAALRELGHDRDEARLRALALLSVGVARVRTPWPVPSDLGDRLLDLLVGTVHDRRNDR